MTTVRALPLLLLLSLSACTDSDLKKVSKGLLEVGQGISIVQTSVIEANKQLLIDDTTTSEILNVCTKINLAGKDATAITRALSKLDQTSKTQVLEILRPVIFILDEEIKTGLLGIKNPETQQKVRASLLAIQTTLNSIQLIIAGGA